MNNSASLESVEMFATGDSCEVIKTEQNDDFSKSKATPDPSAVSFLNRSYTPSIIDTHHQVSGTTDNEALWEQIKA